MLKNLELYGYLNKGFEGQVIRIDTDIHPGFPGFDIIGLPDSAIKESRDRVRTALRNCNFKFPQQHVLVSLSPASVPKQGSTLDLGIALSILFASDKTKQKSSGPTVRIMTAGELALDGSVVSDNSCIGAIEAAKRYKCNLCLIPFTETDLNSAFLKCGEFINSNESDNEIENEQVGINPVFSDILGLEKQKYNIAVCASGMHSMLLFGPPGVGKTMMSGRIKGLLTKLDSKDSEVVSHIYGCATIDCGDSSIPKSQIVAHDSSLSQFVGGSGIKTPGIGALAHCGVLVLDEITKYSPKLLEAVKDAYDKGYTISSKSGETVRYPSKFLMVGNMNVCPCGGLGSNNIACTCNGHKIESYWSKLGRPLIERFDARIPIEETDLTKGLASESKPDSYYINRIENSVRRQKERFKNYEINFNGQMHFDSSILSIYSKEIEILTKIDPRGVSNIRNLISIISLAQSFADFENANSIEEMHILSALELKKYGLGDYYWRTIR